MTTPAFAAEDLVPGGPGALTERYIDESTSRELAPPTTSKSSWVKDAPAIAGYEFESFSQTTDHIYSQEEINFIVGYPDKTVRGDRSLSRCEAVTIFSRLYNGVYPEAKQRLTEKTFSDVPAGVWYYDKLSVCYNAGILSWCGDGKFQPYAAITRAEFAAMAAAFAELPQAENAPFSDINKTHWAYDDINSAAEAGWIVGYQDGTFRPESEISRAETVTLINRLRNRSITAAELRALGVQNPYTDLSEGYWAYGELIEATVKHNAADWHKLNYNEENLNPDPMASPVKMLLWARSMNTTEFGVCPPSSTASSCTPPPRSITVPSSRGQNCSAFGAGARVLPNTSSICRLFLSIDSMSRRWSQVLGKQCAWAIWSSCG